MFANDLKKEDFKVVSLHPGFVATDMGANASSLMSEMRPGKQLTAALELIAAECKMQSKASKAGIVSSYRQPCLSIIAPPSTDRSVLI